MGKAYMLYNRDLSWLGFNHRVLLEAAEVNLPLYERIKFLAIYSANLDEFFRVRVAAIRHLLKVPTEAEQASILLQQINELVEKQQDEFGSIFKNQIIPALKAENIHLLIARDYTAAQKQFLEQFFLEEVLYQLQPILLVKGKLTPFLQNGALYLVTALCAAGSAHKTGRQRRVRYALLKIPENLPRFISLPGGGQKYVITFIDDVIRNFLDKIFVGYDVLHCHSIKLSRDADLGIEDEYSGNLVEKVRKSLNRRKTGPTSRFLYDALMPENMLEFLRGNFHIKRHELVPGARYHSFADFFKFPNPRSPELERQVPTPLALPGIERYPTLFEAIKQRDWLLHFPYQSYDYVIHFLNEAAIDPKVKGIKATQYRVASDSAVVNAFITAARNGKQVTVFVEVKARFDEEANLLSAKRMEQAGVRIIYSIPGLKVHAKCCLVIRDSANRKGRRKYAFVSTGNFNEKTARLYADHGYFTSRPGVTDELDVMFWELENQQRVSAFKNILVSKFNMVDTYQKLIQSEIFNAMRGEEARIFIKLNNLEDPEMIAWLYKASESGVQVDIIVRSVCCLIPGKRFSKNIRIHRIVDMYLEHARVLIVHNGGNPRVFMASADWMKRNLHHRIELGIEIFPEDLRDEMLHIYDLQWKDNQSARWIDKDMEMHHITENSKTPIRAQEAIYQYLQQKLKESR
jgi:polyphosphate kinase